MHQLLVCMCMNIYICMCVCMYVYVYVCILQAARAESRISSVFICTRTYAWHQFLACMCACMYTCIMLISGCTCCGILELSRVTTVYAHTYMYTYIRTCMSHGSFFVFLSTCDYMYILSV